MSKFTNQLRVACAFGVKGVSRRGKSFCSLWLALGFAVVMFILMAAAGHTVMVLGDGNSLAAILGASNVSTIYRGFLLAGISVCILQSQLLAMRALREERRHLLQMTALGIHPFLILFAKGFEYGVHAIWSYIIGTILGGLAVAVFLPAALRAVVVPKNLLLGAIITLTCVPTTLLFVGRVLRKARSQDNAII